MITLTLFQASTLITAFVSLLLGFFVFFSGKKTKLNFSWLLTSIFISLWSVGLFGVVFSTNTATAWFWQYVLDIGGICVPVMYFNFLLYLTKKEKELVLLQIFSLVAGTTLIILNFTEFFKVGVSPKFGISYWIDPGKLYFLFPLYFSLFVVLCMYAVIRGYRLSTDKDQKRQLMYVLIAQTFGFGGGLTNFFPQLFNIYPFGNYFIILYVIFISYAALKHHLFDIRVIATELLTFSIWIFLSIKILFPETYKDFLINVVIFIAVVIAGISLIRSVRKEVEQKEEIEKMAKEVERAYIVEKQAKEQTEKAYSLEKKANEELKKLDKYKNEFLRQASHDLRTPLTILMGYSDMLLRGDLGKLPKKATGVIERIQDVTQKKIKDINSFLDLEQFRAGKGVVLLKPGVGLSSMLEEITGVLLPVAQSKGIYLKLEKPENPFAISADKEKIESAIFNIISNAVKYTPKGGVTINIKNADAEQTINPDNQNQSTKPAVIIEVKDTGIGIPQDKVKGIFEEQFKRTEQAEKTAEGSGVGLYLSGQIIKLHKGKAWAESEGEGKGSTFYVELPVS